MNPIKSPLHRWILLFAVVSFLGWTLETIACYIQFGYYLDRGFLHVPFCPIYGTMVLLVLLLMGTPKAGGILFGNIQSPGLRVVLYFLSGALLASALELGTGLLFEKLYGVVLWDYTWHTFDFMKYTSLEMTLLWGVLILLAMGLLVPLLMRLLEKLPDRLGWIFSGVFLLVVMVDGVICFLIS